MISLIILTYNSSEYIDELLSGIIKKFSTELENKDLEIIVADNLSLDDTLKKVEKFRDKIKIVQNGGNFGYAKGNNLATKKASGEVLIFMNPDAKFIGGDIFSLVSKFENEKIGIVGGKIMALSGKPELSCGKFYKVFNTFLLALGLEEKFGVRFSPKKERSVDFVSGAFLAIRRSLFEKLNGFDENYFMYVEDSDLCYRTKKAGFITLFSPLATIQHVGQGSSNRNFAVINIYKGLMYFNRKNGNYFSYNLVRLILISKAKLLVKMGKILNNKYLTDTYSSVGNL